MHHSPDHVHPRDVKDFHPKDRAIAALIDEALRGPETVRRPGEIGGVACAPSFDLELLSEPLEES
jgi:hypothetical protein